MEPTIIECTCKQGANITASFINKYAVAQHARVIVDDTLGYDRYRVIVKAASPKTWQEYAIETADQSDLDTVDKIS
jgi:hypothetical protein